MPDYYGFHVARIASGWYANIFEMSNNRPKLERALRRLIRAAIDAADLDQQVIDEELQPQDFYDEPNDTDQNGEAGDTDDAQESLDSFEDYPAAGVTSISKYFRRMARRRLRYAYRDLRAALNEESPDDVLPMEIVAILPPEFLAKQIPDEQAEEFRAIGRSKGLKGEALDRFVLRAFRKTRQP